MLGKEVKVLVNDVKSAGNYKVLFNGSSIASGVYFYRITAVSSEGNKEFVSTKKFMLIK